MAVEGNKPYVKYDGNGVTTLFPITYKYIEESDIEVYVLRSGSLVQKKLGKNDYSFENETTIKFPAVTSTEPVLGNGDILNIVRETDIESDFIFPNQQRLYPQSVQQYDDREMMILQELKYATDRSVKVSETSSISPDEYTQELFSGIESALEAASEAASSALEAGAIRDETAAIVDGFDANVQEKTNTFNSNASDKTSAFDLNATNKTNLFNQNALDKTSIFDTNADDKISDFNDNATEKTGVFDSNYTEKTDAFNSNATTKTNEFNANAAEKQDAIDLSAAAAAASESNASGFAVAAGTSATNAMASETNAANSASIASAASVDATQARNEAEGFKDVAGASASSAAQSASNAAGSETAAMASEDMAKASEEAAKVSETNALNSASSAANSAATATTQAGIATTKANNAMTWAEGTDSEVSSLGGEKSAKGWAAVAQSLAQVSDASETVKGIVQLATDSEADAGINNTKAMTPSKVSRVVSDSIGRGLVLGFDGTLSGTTLTFEPSDGTPYDLKNNYDYEIDLFFQAVGELPDTTTFVIKNGSETIPVRNTLSGSMNADYGDMKQLCKYDTDFGWRWIFQARYKENYDDKAFVIPAVAVAVRNNLENPNDTTIPSTKAVSDSLTNFITKENYATSTVAGIVKVQGGYGVALTSTNILIANRASDSEILEEESSYKPIVASTYRKAVKNVTYDKAEIDGLLNNIDALPSQTGNAGKFLKTDGTDSSWSDVTQPTITYWEGA